ncbi:MAG TPA: NAD-dependent epimerase/dehydratase family protein [Gallicola sp.]|nr:NAD-dependent epimerase/dehydratase family protein [Gallicola sp.]
MNTKTYTIGISCIGSGVGQSVISSLRLSRLPLKTVGLGTNPFAYGAYECDTYDYTKSIYAEGYVDNLIEICKKHNIDLVIPGLDDEALIYAQNAHKFEKAGIKAMYADEELISICRDKERMSLELNEIVDVFVKSYNKETLIDDIEAGKVIFPFIAKPRGGFASRGVEIIRSKEDVNKITEDHIIQELAIPKKDDPNYEYYMGQINKNINPQVSEVSIQVVYSPEGKLLGRMFSYNKLNNGVPIEIVPYENEYIWSVIDKLTPVFLKMGLRGPLNIQGRLTENGLKLFEMNPRFTGITGLRALMGFNEVESCVKEWLGIDKGNNQLRFNYNRFGIRQTADRSIPIERNKEVLKLFKHLNNGEVKTRKTIMVTGASGYLGQNLINKLIELDSYEIWAYGNDKRKLINLYQGKVETLIDNDDLSSGRVQLGNVDILLHHGFTRPHGSNIQIADSLKFTNDLFVRAVTNHVPAIINVSSQSVYGQETPPLWKETTPPAPHIPYAQAKYATELLLKSMTKFNPHIRTTSLRLAALSGGQPGAVIQDLPSKLVNQILSKKDITILGGTQQLEFMDVRDAVNAIIALMDKPSVEWSDCYNLGAGIIMNLVDIATTILNIANTRLNMNARMHVVNQDSGWSLGMDSQKFTNFTQWKPQYSLVDITESLIDYQLNYHNVITH